MTTGVTTTRVVPAVQARPCLDRFWVLTYRALVLQTGSRLPDPAIEPDVADHAQWCGCRGQVWRLCGTPDDCLAVAMLTDDQAPFLAGVSRVERAELFAAIETCALTTDPWLLGHRGRQAG